MNLMRRYPKKLSEHEYMLLLLEQKKREKQRAGNAKPFDLLELVLATHPNYLAGWFHRVLCAKLEEFLKKVENKESPRLIINCPPRHGKSTLVSEKFPVRVLSGHPDWNIIVASYSAVLAERFSRRARDTIRDPFVRENAPHLSLSRDRQGVGEWETSARGGYKAAGILGSITGSGAQIFVIDDPVKDFEEAYSEAIREKVYETYRSVIETRLAPGGGILLTQTRWHEDDLSGRLLVEEPELWDKLIFPAIAEQDEEFRKAGEALHPERYDLEKLNRIKEGGGWVWNALYQQRPVSPEGGLIKRKWWRFYDELPAIDKFDEIIQSWDAAFKGGSKNDYVVGQVWGRIGTDAYLIAQVRAQMTFSETLKAIKVLSAQHPYAVLKLIEDKANGPAIIDSLGREIGGFLPVEPGGSKEARCQSISPYIETGNVYIPNPKFNHWVDDFIDECASFPRGANDDQVDAMSQALRRLLGAPIIAFA